MIDLHRLFTVVVFSSLLFSCKGGEGQSRIELYQSDSMRQILQYDNSNLIVNISVNGGADQTFNINGSLSSSVVSVSGIRPGEQNEINIIWIEVVNGRNIEISQQQQSFNADGNTTIDAAHNYSLFDYDNDSASNFDERIDGTCIWDSNEQCDPDNESPPNTSGNLLSNGDFSNGATDWFYLAENPSFLEGELCVTSPTSAVQRFETYIGHSPVVALDVGVNYMLSFDIKADVASTVYAVGSNVENEQFIGVLDRSIDVSTNYQRIEVPFSVFENWPNVRFTLSLGNGQAIRYCVDNFSLVLTE